MTILENKKLYKNLIYLIILVGILLRILALDIFPIGLNCDEASASYDAYSILTTLRDRNDVFLPVYLIAWGSGQSALLTYLMIPFIKLLGLNIIATRIPMAIISSITLYVFYKILSLSYDENFEKNRFYIFFGLLFFVLNPWHIMKSRFGLDCNLFPDLVLFGVYYLIKFFSHSGDSGKHTLYLIISFIFFSISSYSYAVAYPALTLFSILIFIYGIKNKKLKIRHILYSILTTLIITWPIILFVILNFLGKDSISLPFLTIPTLKSNRMLDNSILTEGNIILTIFKNVVSSLKLYIFQYDSHYWNGIKGIGMYYLFSFPIFIIGTVSYLRDKLIHKKKNIVDDIFLLWFISGFIVNLFHAEININRGNFIIIPIIYFIIKGFGFLFNIKVLKMVSIIILLASFSYFSYLYIGGNIKKAQGILIEGVNYNSNDTFAVGLEPAIKKADSIPSKEICFYSNDRERYIYVLYYLKIDPKLYYESKKLYSEDKIFNAIKSFGKWRFDRPQSLMMDKDYVYIFEKEIAPIIDQSKFDIDYIGNYIVVRYNN